MGVIGSRYKLWWSGNSDGTGGVGVLVKDSCVRRLWRCERRVTE